ncbi:hypothetical protein LINPERPRIM_LOCUS23539, partial [Linum perenne]
MLAAINLSYKANPIHGTQTNITFRSFNVQKLKPLNSNRVFPDLNIMLHLMNDDGTGDSAFFYEQYELDDHSCQSLLYH